MNFKSIYILDSFIKSWNGKLLKINYLEKWRKIPFQGYY